MGRILKPNMSTLVSSFIAVVILLQLIHIGVPAPSRTTSGLEFVLDINYKPLDLGVGEIYSIQNHATGLALLHDRPGANVTRPSHWWTLVHLEDNVYYLQIQEILANASAPRWDRRVRLEKASGPGYYHLHPVSCFKFKTESNPKPDAYFYVDYFDENGRDNSECVGINSTRNDWITQLEEENIANMPRDVLNRKNFEYKFTSLSTGLETRLRESGKVMSLTTSPSNIGDNRDGLILPRLNFHEENSIQNLETVKPKASIPYDCDCKDDLTIERPYFTFSIPSHSKFRLSVGPQSKHDLPESETVTISGWMGNKIGRDVSLKYSTWTLKWKEDEIFKKTPTSLSILSLNGLEVNSDKLNKSRNYVYYDQARNDFGFYWSSSSSSPQIQVRFGPPEENDLCTCHLPLYWGIHPYNIMGGLIFIVFGIVLIYTRVIRLRKESNGLRDVSQLNNSQSSPYNGKFKDKMDSVLLRCGFSGPGSNGSKEKKIMLQSI